MIGSDESRARSAAKFNWVLSRRFQVEFCVLEAFRREPMR
jgi:hypothetical protein